MVDKIKNNIEIELPRFLRSLDKNYSLSKTSPLLFRQIANFLCAQGKRSRPILFVIGYLGFSKNPSPQVYRAALSLELLHDFMLVHDDIIDKSATRRGRPSMHAFLNQYLKNKKFIKFTGEDLALVIGDVMYAAGLHAFLSIKEDLRNKDLAMKRLIEAAIYTGVGEFLELIYGMKDIARITKNDIYKVYDLKTAHYTFASPLAIGSTLAGAPPLEVNRLFRYGITLGRAFQIKDDILGIFGKESQTGKSTLTDLKESKKTILVWHAYQNCPVKNRKIIRTILAKKNILRTDLKVMQMLIKRTNSLKYAQNEIANLLKKASLILKSCRISPDYKNILNAYSQNLLKV